MTTLKRKVAPYVAAPAPPAAEVPPDAVVEKASRGRKPPEAPAAQPAEPAAADGRVIDDVYQALMGLGHSPVEARARLDSLLSSGKSFATVSDALALIYGQKG